MAKEISKIYNPIDSEAKWYAYWINNKIFESKPDNREAFTVVIPPPNVTGVLHMGHMLNNTIQDVLVRRARMQGKNACWVPGTDHASIATEAKVVQMLRERGIKKSDLSRDEFLSYAWEWKEKYGGIILKQLEKLGASCDWNRTRFTMEPSLSQAVIDTFVDLYEKGLIYRGLRMVNWDPQGKTALSDEEVIYKEVQSKLYYVRYFFTPNDLAEIKKQNPDAPHYMMIATTRPETILADVALCVHPEDDRYKHLIGKKCLVPFIQREIPIISDEYIDKEFGTGCLKVTPAHDLADYEMGLKHNLEVIDILTEDGIINEKAQDDRYIGKDRFAVRKQIAIDLEEAGHIEKIEEYKNQVGTSERTGAVIEPRLSLQWWVDMKQFLNRNPQVLDAVMNDEIRFHPAKMKNTYKHWIENIKDWCISRQLWWGQQIPAWYAPDGSFQVAKTADEALAKFAQLNCNWTLADIKQDEDVVDTWFSSWLWPISVFNGFENPKNPDISYYYPTQDLVTAPEIMFFWVARMIMAGYEWRGEKPFSNVYYTGIVRDKQRRKMSKSLGNSPDPLDLIAKFGADGVRMGMLLCSPAGNDILFDESQVEQGRNFANKIWNAYRLVAGWDYVNDSACSVDEVAGNQVSFEWMQSRINAVVAELDEKFSDYRLSEALMLVYKLIWDDFCSWYLEMVKPVFGKPINESAYNNTIEIFDQLMRVLHPFMPFISEEIWQELKNRNESDSICTQALPANSNIIEFPGLNTAFQCISKIREFRNSKGISPKESFGIYIQTETPDFYMKNQFLISKLANVRSIEANIQIQNSNGVQIALGKDTLILDIQLKVDESAEKERIQKEIDYFEGFMKSVDSKLNNERFVANAKPELVEKERQKKADALSKIEVLKATMASFKN